MVIGMMPARCSPMDRKAGMLMSMCVASHSGHRFVTYTRILPPAIRNTKGQLLGSLMAGLQSGQSEDPRQATCFQLESRIGNLLFNLS
jgi:hypothetical protein